MVTVIRQGLQLKIYRCVFVSVTRMCSNSLNSTTDRLIQMPTRSGVKGSDRGQGEVVLVTGGAGFLGQHIVNLLQTRAPHVTEIRVLDLKPYVNHLTPSNSQNAAPRCQVHSYNGCLTDTGLLARALIGVDSVYHVAGLISYGTFPDYSGMNRINIEGTRNIIKACHIADVSRLIFCSTVDVAIGNDDIINGDEVTTAAPPRNFLFPGYPESKYRAECLVLAANGSKTENGNHLHTLSLRANVMYGEGDPYYVTNGLRSAQKSKGIMHRVGDGTAFFQQVYVGNTAWAFICADKSLRDNVQLGGHFYYVPDDTPIQNTFSFMKPFLQERGYKLSERKIPYALAYYGLLMAEFIVNTLSPFYRITLPSQSYTVKYINMNLYFTRRKAEKELGFKPIFTPEIAIQRCLKYYRDLKL